VSNLISDLLDGGGRDEKVKALAGDLADEVLRRVGRALAELRDQNKIVITVEVRKEG
jgi:hypothetical protein